MPRRWMIGVAETVEPGDTCASAAATRALHEELGVRPPDSVTTIGIMTGATPDVDILCVAQISNTADLTCAWEIQRVEELTLSEIGRRLADPHAREVWVPQSLTIYRTLVP